MSGATNEFGGEERFAASPEKLYGLLTNLDAMSATIPDLVSAERVDERTLKCVVRPGFSFLRGTMKLTMTLGETSPPSSAAMTVSAQGIGVAMDVASQLSISPDGAGSRLLWTAQDRGAQGPDLGGQPGPDQGGGRPGHSPRLEPGPQTARRVTAAL